MLIPEKRIADFEKLGFGLFIHWGVYSQVGKGEWYFYHEDNLTFPEYMKLKDTFTAEDFDAERIARAAKEAGCKYITLTTRHHEGFSLYDTCGLNDFDAPHSPAKRDLIKEFVDACRKYDLIPFFYHTTLDWYREDYKNNFDEYLEYLRKSVEILCTNYGKIGGLWFDGNWDKPDADWKLDELYGTIRKHQPDAMIINNTGLSARGELGHPEIDAVTYEQGRPEPLDRSKMSKYITGEMCYTMNDHWAVGYNDLDYKSTRELIECLCDCRKVGANFLLNIGPSAQGGIISIQEEFLKIMGRWTKVYGEAIYDGKPYSICDDSKDFILKSDKDEKVLYLFAYDLGRLGSENVVLNGGGGGKDRQYKLLDGAVVKELKWMDNDEVLEFKQNGNNLEVACTGFPYGCNYCVRVAKVLLS